jgi:hypothetical protein
MEKKGCIMCAVGEEVGVGVAKQYVVDVLKEGGKQIAERSEQVANVCMSKKG